MYKTILITLDTTPADETILAHIRQLAHLCGSRLVLLHVADGWAARAFGQQAESPEVRNDRAYLGKIADDLRADGFEVETHLAYGDPATEIVKYTEEQHCDLLAMSPHGHRFLADLFLGTTANKVQHRVNVPILLLKAR